MTDTSAAPEAPEDNGKAAASARFDNAVSGVMGLADFENINGALLKGAVRQIKAAIFAALDDPGDPPAEAPRDETHDSIDPHTGTLTADAAAARAARLPTAGGMAVQETVDGPSPEGEASPEPVDPGVATSPAA